MARLLMRSEEHTSELQSPCNLVCRLLLEKKKNILEKPRFGARTPRGSRPRRRAATRRLAAGTLRSARRARALLPYAVLRFLFFFNDTATTEIYTLSLHDALPISLRRIGKMKFRSIGSSWFT